MCDNSIKDIQGRLYDMLVELDDFCREYNIKYVLEGGTALGAFRHHGFIPWDDDLDIAMDIESYRKFCKILKSHPTKNLRLQCHNTDSVYINRYAKVRDINSIIQENGIGANYKERGCFIDVFPLEYSFPFLISLYHILHRPLFYLSRYNYGKYLIGKILVSIYFRLCSAIVCLFRVISHLFNCSYYSYGYGCNVYTYKYRYKKEWFENVRLLKFVNQDFPVPGEIEKYLTIQYGKNYMQLPPVEDRQHRHMNSIILR